MTTEEVIRGFIQAIGDKTWTLQEVDAYFESLGIDPKIMYGSLFLTPGIHNQNNIVWYSNGIVKMPPNQPH